ncbi:P-loop containing nucleoside triphosphate hydrolase protein [Penicillium capsulatum]|uniref:P-loop containing nucleoside triphosphate hydrolase protein n=1 Tax=Penicillium capsulatum TaxID=69766 RepID=A0A9W9LXE2_9EURO|nr:P-loop containing nucleoside triphosphate hydrolase protein [Penicillium capsulatum]KAJ6121511.1 P-loop containing nucleoside triphosphate hydrolase protein [Penicillium capsulatum]
MQFKPFAEGPIRPKQIISLGFYRTGSQSLAEALTILGYRDVYHSSAMVDDAAKWVGMGIAADDNIACLPSYTGRTWARDDWNNYFGPCEVLTDVTPFADPLLRAFPEARVILVHRDIDAWMKSFQETLVLPTSGALACLNIYVLEPVLGLQVHRSAWKMYMGLLGVCSMDKARDERIMRSAYQRHYDAVRRMIPRDRLLEIDLAELEWKPLCEFLGKEVPDVSFPRSNESVVFRDLWRGFYLANLKAVLLKLVGPVVAVGTVITAVLWKWS